MTDIKTKIAEYDQRSITQTETPRLYALSEEILKKFGIN